eukprot:m.385195 g.385195  ORF g.385195 m.385195 type:complete len:149 (-) comp56279_c0_seq1:2765-3211(-)
MFIPTKNRRAIHEAIFADGVLVAIKDLNLGHHCQLKNVPNLHVIKAMTSLKSKGFVKEQFSWNHYFWTLTNEGIDYLRTYLGLPAEVIPKSLQKPAAAPKRLGGGSERPPREAGDRPPREGYRARPQGDAPRGAGRGRGAPAAAAASE